jgi:hypothetical protein
MCDSGCDVTFTSNKVTVKHGVATILDGTRDLDSVIWRVPLHELVPNHSLPLHTAHSVYTQNSVQDTISYVHAYCFSPVQDTWIKAIVNGQFATWSGVTVDNILKYLPKSDATVKGHMNQIQQNIRSTQPKVTASTPEPDMVHEDKYRYVYAAIMETGQTYTDITCGFSTTSHSGKKYILVLYDYDRNSVLSAPMKNRGDKEMVRAFD